MDEKRYCVHAALGRRGDRLRLVRVRPGHSGVVNGASGGAADGASGGGTGALPAAAGRTLPLTGSRPVVLAEGLTQAQAERLAALLSGLVDADAPSAPAGMKGPAVPAAAPSVSTDARTIHGDAAAVRNAARLKAEQGLALLREALLAVMAATPGGMTAADLARALGITEAGQGEGEQLMSSLLALLLGQGVVRHDALSTGAANTSKG